MTQAADAPLSSRTIYLVGPRASGKTSLGRKLAAKLGREFLDMDALFCERHGCEVADLVFARGWESFRDAEAKLLAEVAGASAARTLPPVVATGGGAVLRPENRRILKDPATAFTIYLHVTPRELTARLSLNPMNAQRPSLTGLPVAEEAARIAVEREPLYREVAHLTLNGDGHQKQILATLLQNLPS